MYSKEHLISEYKQRTWLGVDVDAVCVCVCCTVTPYAINILVHTHLVLASKQKAAPWQSILLECV